LPLNSGIIEDQCKLTFILNNPFNTVMINNHTKELLNIPDEIKDFIMNKGNNSRIYKNSIIILSTNDQFFNKFRDNVKNYLAWSAIEKTIYFNLLNDSEKEYFFSNKNELNKFISLSAVYNHYITLDSYGNINFNLLKYNEELLNKFDLIVDDLVYNERLLMTALSHHMIIPGGFLNIWDGCENISVFKVLSMFFQFYRLPKVCNPFDVYNAIAAGIMEGIFIGILKNKNQDAVYYWNKRMDVQFIEQNQNNFEICIYDKDKYAFLLSDSSKYQVINDKNSESLNLKDFLIRFLHIDNYSLRWDNILNNFNELNKKNKIIFNYGGDYSISNFDISKVSIILEDK
jgi:hypothetical protein